MSYNQSVAQHYHHGNLLNAIEASLPSIGKTRHTVNIDNLAAVDEFHIGGQAATQHLLNQLPFNSHSKLLDIGCGLGGAARYIATHCGSQITGIDLTQEYVQTGNELCKWVNLSHLITLQHGSALTLPYANNAFNGAYMLHVGMNIANKQQLFNEVYRVLSPNSTFAIYDIMLNEGLNDRINDSLNDEQSALSYSSPYSMAYPVPWATNENTSKLNTPQQYQQALTQAGFTINSVNNRHRFALTFFQKQAEVKNSKASIKPATSNASIPLSLHTLMKKTTSCKINNMIANINNQLISPVEIIVTKPSNQNSSS